MAIAPATAFAQSAAPAHHTVTPDVGCVNGKAAESAELNPGDAGTVLLCYNSGSRAVWAKLISNIQACQEPSGTGTGCGGAIVVNSDGQSEQCTIPVNATGCSTKQINDANLTSTASANIFTNGKTGAQSFGSTYPPF